MDENIDINKKLAASEGGEPRPEDSGREKKPAEAKPAGQQKK